jgi:hypothetical protein
MTRYLLSVTLVVVFGFSMGCGGPSSRPPTSFTEPPKGAPQLVQPGGGTMPKAEMTP